MIWRTMTKMMTDVVIGPELRNIRRIQPMSGRSMTRAGSWIVSKVPALPLGLISRLR